MSSLATFAKDLPRALPVVAGVTLLAIVTGCSPATNVPPPADATTSTSGEMRFVPEVGRLATEDGEKARRRSTPSRTKGKPQFRDRAVSYADASN